MKPWLNDPFGRKLQAYVGSQKISTNQFESTEELIFFAAKLFGLPEIEETTLSEAAQAVDQLGRKERKARAAENIGKLGLERKGARSEIPASLFDDFDAEAAFDRVMKNRKPQWIDGAALDCDGQLDIDPAKLLRKVVSAVISADRADILWEFPEVLAFFGSRIPDPREVAHHHRVDERMFEAKAKWPNLKK